MFTNLFCHSASTVRENSAGFFVIANYYSLNIFIYEQTISNPKFLLSLIIILLFLMMIAFTFIRRLCKVAAHLQYCSNIAYQHIEQLKKWQEEDHRLMVKIITNGKDIIEFNNNLIKENKNLRETPEQKSK